MAVNAVIETKDLVAGYGERVVLEKINFHINQGEVVAVVGRSGSGKSTLLKHLIGLNPPLGGEVWIEGKNLAQTIGPERQELLRTFGVLYQSGALFGSMTVFENVRLPLHELTDLPDRAKDMVTNSKLRLVGLSDAANVLPAELSGGMQKRAALARAMALDPRILFLDEPSVGLDPITAAGLDETILQLSCSFGITFVIITHDMESIFTIASRVLMVDEEARTIIAEGKPADLRDHSKDARVRALFHRQARPQKQPRSTENGHQ
ncbi:MAG: polyamine ABC transporter ATP-binding protein [Verrucomicrobia bacterium]|nr:MAG: polyamine ABC transporter ATP-binding protein [Verrucomicrobiota bacterium]